MFDFTIDQVCDIVGLERQTNAVNERSFNVRCPLCNDKQYKLNIDRKKGVWRCAKCGVDGGTLDLYAKFVMGRSKSECDKATYNKARQEIVRLLGISECNPYRGKQSYEDDYTKLSDSDLHKVYNALLNVPGFELTDEHYSELKQRGLPQEMIVANEYRSIPKMLYISKRNSTFIKQLKNEFEVLCKDNDKLNKLGFINLLSGVAVSSYLLAKGLSLAGVPGFFKINNLWCFNYIPGILIPVRNISGEIVGLQVRTKSKSCKYMTVSSKGYDGGTAAMCRVHFPKNNPKLKDNAAIYLTEGPLKADTALSLTKNRNIAYIAISGVNTTKDLSYILNSLKTAGCKHIYNALDIDKITNPHVAKACENIKEIINKSGFQYTQIFWDESTARNIYNRQRVCMDEFQLPVTYNTENIFERVLQNTLILHNKNIAFDHHWPNDKAKGIDDYLLNELAV